MRFYRAALPLSSRTLNFTAAVVRRHLKASLAGRQRPVGLQGPARVRP
jgi:hypothetical protein